MLQYLEKKLGGGKVSSQKQFLDHDRQVQVAAPFLEHGERRSEENDVADGSQAKDEDSRAGGKRRKKCFGSGRSQPDYSASILA
mgnify:CR=1 FL=1